MELSSGTTDASQTIIMDLGGMLCVWDGINLLKGYEINSLASKSQGIKQLVAGGDVALIDTTLIPLLSRLPE